MFGIIFHFEPCEAAGLLQFVLAYVGENSILQRIFSIVLAIDSRTTNSLNFHHREYSLRGKVVLAGSRGYDRIRGMPIINYIESWIQETNINQEVLYESGLVLFACNVL